MKLLNDPDVFTLSCKATIQLGSRRMRILQRWRWKMAVGRHLDLLRFILRWDGSFWRRSPGKFTGSLVRARRPSLDRVRSRSLKTEFTAETPRGAESAQRKQRKETQMNAGERG
jgi:hypothetical protein